MITFKEIVEESFGELFEDVQATISSNDYRTVIEKYWKEEVFVTYTELPKVGINPQSKYKTPIGIYCYDIAYISDLQNFKPPFPEEWKYFHIMRPNKGIGIWRMSRYDKEEFKEDMEKIRKAFSEGEIREALKRLSIKGVEDIFKEKLINGEYEELDKIRFRVNNFYPRIMFYFTNILTDSPIRWNMVLRKVLGYDLVWDDLGAGIIHSAEERQAFFTNGASFKIVISGERVEEKQISSDDAFQRIKKLGVNREIPKKLLNAITNDEHNSFEVAKLFYNSGKEIPEILIKSIATSIYYSLELAKLLKFKNVPEDLIYVISMDQDKSYAYAKYANFGKNGEVIPLRIIEKISESPTNTMHYMGALGYRNIPEILLGKIANIKNYRRDFIKVVEYDEARIPKIIMDRVDKADAFYLAKGLDFENVPEWLKKIYGGIEGIAKEDSLWAYYYAKKMKNLGKKVPVEINDAIASDDEVALMYAKDVLNYENVPKKIMDTVLARSGPKPSNYTIAEEGFAKNLGELFR